jgi:hypothetical protein
MLPDNSLGFLVPGTMAVARHPNVGEGGIRRVQGVFLEAAVLLSWDMMANSRKCKELTTLRNRLDRSASIGARRWFGAQATDGLESSVDRSNRKRLFPARRRLEKSYSECVLVSLFTNCARNSMNTY